MYLTVGGIVQNSDPPRDPNNTGLTHNEDKALWKENLPDKITSSSMNLEPGQETVHLPASKPTDPQEHGKSTELFRSVLSHKIGKYNSKY